MSRTIRRRNSYLRNYYVDSPEEVSSWMLCRYGVDSPSQVIERQLVRFHSDTRSGKWRPPSWYARTLNKAVNRANKAEIHRCVSQDCWDDHQPVRHMKNAGYTWF